MSKDSHVLKRDGSTRLGGPRPRPPARPAPPKREAKPIPAGSYSDSTTVGWYDVTDVLKAVGGQPSPRQLAQGGDKPGGTHTEPGDKLESGVPVPID